MVVSSVLLHKVRQGRKQTVHFIGGVVMHEADTQDAPKLLDVEALGEIQRIEIPVPGEYSALTEKRRDFRWMMVAQPERQRRAAFVKSMRIGDAEDAHARNGPQSRDQLGKYSRFVL